MGFILFCKKEEWGLFFLFSKKKEKGLVCKKKVLRPVHD